MNVPLPAAAGGSIHLPASQLQSLVRSRQVPQDAAGALPAAGLRAAPVVHDLVVPGDPPGERLERLLLPDGGVEEPRPLTRVEQRLTTADRAVQQPVDLPTQGRGRVRSGSGLRSGRLTHTSSSQHATIKPHGIRAPKARKRPTPTGLLPRHSASLRSVTLPAATRHPAPPSVPPAAHTDLAHVGLIGDLLDEAAAPLEAVHRLVAGRVVLQMGLHLSLGGEDARDGEGVQRPGAVHVDFNLYRPPRAAVVHEVLGARQRVGGCRRGEEEYRVRPSGVYGFRSVEVICQWKCSNDVKL